jgi:spermidine/putrescine transport system permease protein
VSARARPARLLAAYSVGVYLFLYAPIVVLAVFSFNAGRQTAVWQGLTFDWYRRLLGDEFLLASFRNSLLVALATTILALAIGVPAALALARAPRRPATLALLLVPLVLPEVVLGAGLLSLFGLLQLRLSLLTVVVAHLVFSVSYVTIVVRARLAGQDPALEEAARDLGAGASGAFWRVTLPLAMPGILASALLVVTLSLDDYVVTSFVAGAGATTLPLQIYSLLKVGVTPEVNAISTLLLVATVLLILAAQRLLVGGPRRRRARPSPIAAAGLLLAAGALLHCGRGTRAPAAPVPAEPLNVFIWTSYLPDDVAHDFERRTGHHLSVDTYSSNEALLEKLQSRVADYDIVVPSDYMVRVLVKEHLLLGLDHRRLRALDVLDPLFLNRPFDPGNQYSLPFLWGTTGIGYNREKVGAIDSWQALFDPRHAGRILMLDDEREAFGAALKIAGRSLNERDPRVLAAAAAKLKAQKPLVRTYNSADFATLLAAGDVDLAQGYSGELARVVADAPQRFAYVVPKEGATLWIDNLAIPATARHRQAAYAFINYLLDPAVAAEIVNRVRYASANRAALPRIAAAIRSDPAVYPPPDVLGRCELLDDLGDTLPLLDRLWTEVKVE